MYGGLDVVKTLDLHGIRHAEVEREVIRFIEANWNTGNELKIIIGHSPVMQKLVVGVLDDYKLDYRIGNYLGFDKTFISVYDV